MSQEKTEEATPQKLRKAQEEGQVPRTKELPTVAILLFAFAFLIMFSDDLLDAVEGTMIRGLTFDTSELDVTNARFGNEISQAGVAIMKSLALLFIGSLFVAIWSNTALGGFQFMLKRIMPDWSNMNPISGLGKMFSSKQLIDLVKSILKVFLVGIPLYYIIGDFFWGFTHMRLTHAPLTIFEKMLVDVLGWGMFFVSLFVVLVAIDVPYQIYSHIKQNRMSKQEVKEEYKNTEGDPMVKAKVRQIQRAMSQQGAKSRVADATIVITNPSHYSVALEYDFEKVAAPVVVGLGKDALAFAIRETAKEKGIPIVEVPPLARALYANSQIDEVIPVELFGPVAMVITLIQRIDGEVGDSINAEFIEKLGIDEDALPKKVS